MRRRHLMSRQSEIAFAHNDRLISIGDLLVKRTKRAWSRMDINNLDWSWQSVAPLMVAQVNAAQVAAASLSAPYLNAIDRSYGYKPIPASIPPVAFSNVMGDGREVGPALFGAVTNTKTLIGKGVSPAQAFQVGSNFIAVVASAALHDAARNADRVLAVGKGYTRYIRVVNGSACSRCAILASIYSAEEAFLRHFSCQCGTAPIQVDGKPPSGFHDSPLSYFDSLSKAEQDRRFTNAGAEAIRNGANPVSIVNARRGANGIQFSTHDYRVGETGLSRRLQPITIGVKADGSPLRVFATAEGATIRGEFGRREIRMSELATKTGRYRRTTTVRLMPEQILKMAGNNPERWRELLGRYGYLN
jgi:hypothetical protein